MIPKKVQLKRWRRSLRSKAKRKAYNKTIAWRGGK